MNRTIKNVKLGAPNSITVSNCDTLENLDVQITENLESISFKGNTGTKNPIARAAKLLKQDDIESNDPQGMKAFADDNHEYWELDCIISNGTSWIDTGIIPNNHSLSIEVTFPERTYAAGIIAGLDMSSSSSIYGLSYGNIAFYGIKYGVVLNSATTLTSSSRGKKAKIKLGTNFTVEVDGTVYSYGSFSTPIETVTTNLLLFGGTVGNSPSNGSTKHPSYKMHSCTIISDEDDSIVLDLIPVMHIKTQRIGMYDKISKTFLTDASGIDNAKFGYKFKYTDSVTLEIPTSALLNGGNTTCEIKSENITLSAKDYYWQIQNINSESTGTPIIDQKGNITIEDEKWAEFDVKVIRYEDTSSIIQHFVLNQNMKG